MTDIERLLRDALGQAADHAPRPHGLAAAARARARARRWRTSAASVGVAAAVLVPVAVFGLDGSEPVDSTEPVPSPTAPSRRTDMWRPDTWRTESWRTESWHDVEVVVPTDWGYGALATWCLGDAEEPVPVVERPGVVPAIACSGPEQGYGVQFTDAGSVDRDRALRAVPGDGRYPDGAWVGDLVLGDVGVHVVVPSERLARRIVASARQFPVADRNGCPPDEQSGTVEFPVGTGTVSVCRYEESGWLEQSELLAGPDVDRLLQAIEDAPIRTDAELCDFPPDRSPVVVLRMDGVEMARVVWDADCARGNGVFLSGVERELTTDVLYWSLSPGWSGALNSTYPLPDQFRD